MSDGQTAKEGHEEGKEEGDSILFAATRERELSLGKMSASYYPSVGKGQDILILTETFNKHLFIKEKRVQLT